MKVADTFVTFSVAGHGDKNGQLSATKEGDGNGWTTISVLTDSSGAAQVYFAPPDRPDTKSHIGVRALDQQVTFNQFTDKNDGDIASPSGINQTNGNKKGEYILHWINHATNATHITVQQSIDGFNWTSIAMFADPHLSACRVEELDPSNTYYFGVFASKDVDPDEPKEIEADAKEVARVYPIAQ